jgi:serine/threonine-protein kinase
MALQIAEGLEEAHAKAIVHRDLKPANVMLLPNGRIKLLDFGLARAYLGDSDEPDTTMSPTITAAMTQQGVILGTAAYMSPEQARGKSVDRQTDIWAYGALVFELLTGHRIFKGETISDSIGAILHKDPDWSLLPANMPPQVHQLLRRCLERDMDRRLRDISDARVALQDARTDPTGSSLGLSAVYSAPASSSRRRWVLALLAAVLGLSAGLLIGSFFLVQETQIPFRKLDLGIDVAPSSSQDNGVKVAIAPDAHAVAFIHEGQIWIQNLDELEPRALEGSDDGISPFWSSDSGWVAWFQDNRLWKAPTHGGRPVSICEVSGQIAGGVGGSWGDDDQIVFCRGTSGVYSVSALGGKPREIIPIGEGNGDLHDPSALPTDKGVLFVTHPEGRSPGVLTLWRDGVLQTLFEAGQGTSLKFPMYDGDRHILFRLERGDATEGLWALEFDLSSGAALGEPFLVEPNASAASVAADGTLVFVSNPGETQELMISRLKRNGSSRETVVPARTGTLDFRASPDGNRIAFVTDAETASDRELWVRDLARGTEMRIATAPFLILPVWSSDGRELFFSGWKNENGSFDTWRVPADGSGSATILTSGMMTTAVDDGENILLSRSAGEDTWFLARSDSLEIWMIPLDDPAAGRVLLGGDAQYYATGVAPSGDYLLYGANVSGEMVVYLTRYPDISGRWQVSRDGAISYSSFGSVGSTIHYRIENRIFEVDFASGPTPGLGTPREFMDISLSVGGMIAVERGGQSVLAVHAAADAELAGGSPRRQGIKVVQNWTLGIPGH